MKSLPYDITLLMTSLLVVFHVSKVATLTHVKAIHSQPYFHMCISVLQPVSNIGIAVFPGIAVFSGIAVFPGIAVFSGIVVFPGIAVFTGIAIFAGIAVFTGIALFAGIAVFDV